MKKYVITVLCLIYTTINIGLERQFELENTLIHYQNFLKAYEHIRKWEGNYSNLPFDKGGETYGGITRNFNQNWIGWGELEKYKEDSVVCWNQYIPNMENHVRSYYYEKWIEEGFYKIKEPLVANYLFDYRNTGPIAIKHAQQVLIEHGFNVTITKSMNNETIDAINKINPIVFVFHLQDVRREYYTSVADRNPDLERYLKGWLNRANYVSS